VLGAGGNAGQGMMRCLSQEYETYGWDDSAYSRHLIEHLADPKTEDFYEYDLYVPVHTTMLLDWADQRNKAFLPDKRQLLLAQDKYKTAKVLRDRAPETYWVRDTHGSGGKGAQMCQEFLTGRNCSVELAYVDSRFIASFVKQRLSYSTSGNDSGLDRRGTSMVSVCIKDDELVKIAQDSVWRIAEYTGTVPHGFYGVDFMEDAWGMPKVTEINAGRLLTASYNYFANGYNLPVAGIKALEGADYELGPYPVGLGIVRSYDRPPAFVMGLT
jgi:glutathione synthase/RimK-type ligase-like ATP-grasp enzyme